MLTNTLPSPANCISQLIQCLEIRVQSTGCFKKFRPPVSEWPKINLPAMKSLLHGLRAVACGRLLKPQPIFKEAQEEERADAARRVASAAGGEYVVRDADVRLADDLQCLDE